MFVIRWSVLLVGITLSVLWLIDTLSWYKLSSWQYSIRIIAGLYFLLALVASGIMSVPRVQLRTKMHHSKAREDWAFIFIVVTIALFGVSLWFPS
ncbi:hypothetical protein GXN76_02630 [Kroppenstedtia pulmonis]|uniref:Uncharacterized protein n=1 Tax=Kroppenstedtia pulmonis TaxID=1380685 RepID=A0A7D4BUW9_9BACL|nr:hypothetical protein [Kroppenstedtia pulmonis]QKG83473.1 hypothetical protein GXN76_02630 [Kroppenstedtia pulmonis]